MRIQIITVLQGSLNGIQGIVLVWCKEFRKASVIFTGLFRIVDRDPDIERVIRFTNDSSGGTGKLHDRTGIRAQNVFTA